MKSLTIKDLARTTTELDRHAMAGVSGGTYQGCKAPKGYEGWMPSFTSIDASSNSFSFDATQGIAQDQKTLVNNGNNAAFVSGITANVNPDQKAHNTINFG
ncbi:hypothetical protein EDC30_10819 [Paucimonas lemoignei]|uniref:Uncharacterized protein n=1 Tax=Paucimonas lemoignei TaxID=29443 RepID=A0A4R3HS38_PAULE|nr:hypothetical protein [Paucimonas lemoignei]TCS35956.1 hypothetical protein EDC30_10819 [Paucimonas lemoignei]